MTTVYEAQNFLDLMQERLLAKGKAQPDAIIVMRSNTRASLALEWRIPTHRGHEAKTKYFHGSFGEIMGAADEFVAAMPSPEVAKLNDFMTGLGHLIDAGRDAGISLDHLNPLVEHMKRLSENVITHQPVTDDDQ